MPDPAGLPYGERRLPLPGSPLRLDTVPAPERASRGPAEPVTAGLDRPIGGPPLGDVFRGARRVLVAVSDATRKTGCETFLPALLERIERASRAAVSFVVAGGLHRPSDARDVRRILGEDLVRRYPVLGHDPDDAARLVPLGRTAAGTPVRVNRAVREHDRIVLTGSVAFHYYAGFTGGRKALVPGLAARETIVRNHLRALRRDGTPHPRARAGCLDGNPVHRDMAQAAALAGPHLVVNSVLGADGAIERLFAGHWRRAHEAACRFVGRTRTVRLEPRDVVVVSAGGDPYDIDLIQAHKAFEAAFPALRPGGTLVLAARCPRGAGHDDFLEAFAMGGEAAVTRALREDFRVYTQTALSWMRKARQCRLLMVSSLDAALTRRLGAEPCSDLGAALERASRYHPKGTRGWVVPWGARFCIEPGRPRG